MTDPAQPRPVARFFGGLLMAIGALIVVTAGTCCIASTLGGIFKGGSGPDNFIRTPTDALILMSIFGGIPLVVGVGMFFGGRRLYRGPRPTGSAP